MVWVVVSTASRLFWRHLGMLVAANILWLLLSLLVVTWPAATAGLFYLVRRVVQEELDSPLQEARLADFWHGLRQYWLRSSVLSVIDLAGTVVIAVALVFYGGSSTEPLRWLVGPIGLIGLAWITAQLYVYPLLLERTGSRPWEIMREALLIALGFPLSSLSLLVTVLVLAIAAERRHRVGESVSDESVSSESGVGGRRSQVRTSDSRPPTPDYVAYSGLIIDDIVLADGRTFFNTLGGSGTHALVGMRIWSDRLGYFAAVGSDFSRDHRAQLERLGVDLRGLIERDGYPTARAWQLFEPDERRVEVFRTDIEDFYRHEARFEEMPQDYLEAQGFHLHFGTLTQMTELVEKLRAVNPAACIVWEPTALQFTGTSDEFHAVLSRVDLVSPDLDEARQMTGHGTAEEMVETLLGWGVQIVALRMGARGSLVATAAGEFHMVPAVPTTVVDTTGAGDAYCGGFLVALGSGVDAAEAGARAAVSASFALEQFGVHNFDEQTRVETQRRLTWARERIMTNRVGAAP